LLGTPRTRATHLVVDWGRIFTFDIAKIVRVVDWGRIFTFDIAKIVRAVPGTRAGSGSDQDNFSISRDKGSKKGSF